MLILLSLLAAQAADPTAAAAPIGHPYSPDDFPESALKQGVSGRVRVEVTVSSDGKPIRCEPAPSSGSEELDAVSCSSMMKRGRFKPAIDNNGKPSVSVVRQTANWFIGNSRSEIDALAKRIPRPNEIDIRATVEKLPAGLVSPVVVTTDLVIDEMGSIKHCVAQPLDSGHTAFNAVACRQALLLGRLKPAKDANGTPVSSVQQAKISFALPEAAPATMK